MKTSEPHHTTNYHYIDLNLDMTVLLFTGNSGLYHGQLPDARHQDHFMDALAWIAPLKKNTSKRLIDPEIENYRLQIVRLQDSTISLEAHEAEMERVETEKSKLIRNHRRELPEITQNPVFFTRSGRAWHADERCPRRLTEQGIFMRGYCTLCAHFLGREVPAGEFGEGEPEPVPAD